MVILKNYQQKVKIIPWKILAEFKGKELEGLRIRTITSL